MHSPIFIERNLRTKLRTIRWKFKNTEPRSKFTGSYKKGCRCWQNVLSRSIFYKKRWNWAVKSHVNISIKHGRIEPWKKVKLRKLVIFNLLKFLRFKSHPVRSELFFRSKYFVERKYEHPSEVALWCRHFFPTCRFSHARWAWGLDGVDRQN